MATRVSRVVVAAAAAAALAAAVASCSVKTLSMPSSVSAAVRAGMAVPEIRYRAPARPDALVEHTVERSSHKIPAAAKPAERVPEPSDATHLPVPEPEAEQACEPVRPKPATKPKVRFKPKAKTKPVSQASASVVESERTQEAEPAPASEAAGSAVGAADAHGNSSRDEASMLSAIVQHIEARKRYPRRARQSAQEGTVVLSIRVGADGTVVGVAVAKKAASRLLNRAALSAAASLKGVRVAAAGREVAVEVPVVFSLAP